MPTSFLQIRNAQYVGAPQSAAAGGPIDPNPPVIDVVALSRAYRMGDQVVHALAGVNLTIRQGEFVALVGTSGSGKTTLLSLLGLLDSPSDGRYHLDGEDVVGLSADRLATIRNQKIGFVFQSFNLLPGMRADENVALPLRYAGIPRPERLTRARQMLERVGLADRIGHRPTELSGGQQQRVAVARALVSDPALFLADEPTGNLDSRSSRDIMALFDALHEEGRTLVLVTHDPAVAARASRRVHLEDGRIILDTELASKHEE